MSTQYDYTTFTFPITCGYWYSTTGNNGYSDSRVRLEEWQNHQREILPKLQEFIDKGWETLGEVGPASIKLRHYKRNTTTMIGVIIILVFAVPTFGISLLMLLPSDVVSPTEFSVALRRRK